MQLFQNLPWYGYVMLALGIFSYVYKYFLKAKEGHDASDLKKAKFKMSEATNVSKELQFALAFYTPISEWYGAETNTLRFLNPKAANRYLKRWRIDTADGYWGLTEYFMKDGRRWYYNFITQMINKEPEATWKSHMTAYFGENERAFNYLKVLENNKVQNELKQKQFITFDTEMEVGIAAYDAAILVGQARKAFTANIITEEEALKVIKFAKALAVQHFSSWEAFGKSFIIGFAFDQQHRERSYREEIYHTYQQVLEDSNSPWNTIDWIG